MILSLRPDAWKTILAALDDAAWNYRDLQEPERAEEFRALAESLREIGRQTLHGQLKGYRIPGALGGGEPDIVIQAVPAK